MTCHEVTEFLSDYLARELPPAQHAAFDRHLGECPECVAYVKSFQHTLRLEKEACSRSADPVAEDVPDELVTAILAARRK